MLTSFRAFRNSNYRVYFSGQIVSMTGSWMQSTVQAWLIYKMSHSASWLGIISFCTQLPAFLISPWAGIVADRYDRRKVLLWTEVVGMFQAFLLAALVLSGSASLLQIALLGIVLGLVTGFELTTRHAFAVDLVGKPDLHSAIALNSITINGSRIFGPLLGGLAAQSIGEGWCFFLNGVSYLAVIFGLWKMKTGLLSHPPKERDALRSKPFHQIRDAIRYIRKTPSIGRLMFLAAFLSLFAFPYQILLPVFAKSVLKGDALTLSWLLGVTGVGAILGAFTLGMRTGSGTESALERRLTGFVAVIGFSLIGLGLAHHLVIMLISVFLLGYFLMGAFPTMNSAIQEIVEDSMRGRVLSLYTMTFLGAMPVGSVIAGWIADHTSAKAVAIGSGMVCIVSGLAMNCIYRGKWISCFSWPWRNPSPQSRI